MRIRYQTKGDQKVQLEGGSKGDTWRRPSVKICCHARPVAQPNGEWPYHVYQKLPHEAYKLEELDGRLISEHGIQLP